METALSNHSPSATTNLHYCKVVTIPSWLKHRVSEVKLWAIKLFRSAWEETKQMRALWNLYLFCCSLLIAVYSCAMETIIQSTSNAPYLDPTPGTPSHASFISFPFSIHWKPLQAKIIWKKLPLCITPWAVKYVPHETWGSQSNKFFFWRARCNNSGKRSPHDNKKRKEISGKSEDSSPLQYKASLICTWESVEFEIPERSVLLLAFLLAWATLFKFLHLRKG